MAENLLLGAEVVLEDSSNLQKDVTTLVSKIQKDVDNNPIELKADIGEAGEAMKLIDSSIVSLQKKILELRKSKIEISEAGDEDQILSINNLLDKTKLSLDEIRFAKSRLGEAINLVTNITAGADTKAQALKVVSEIQKDVDGKKIEFKIDAPTDNKEYVKILTNEVDKLSTAFHDAEAIYKEFLANPLSTNVSEMRQYWQEVSELKDKLSTASAELDKYSTSAKDVQFQSTPFDISQYVSDLTSTNITLLQMSEHYKQLESSSAKIAKSEKDRADALAKIPKTAEEVGLMDESSIESRNAKIKEYTRLLNTASDNVADADKIQDSYNAQIERLSKANKTVQSRQRILDQEAISTEQIRAILSGTATTENAINAAIRERVKLQGDLEIGSEAYLQNQRAIDQLTEKLPANIRKSTEAYSNQASVVQQMKGMVDDYIGLYAIFRGMDSIVQTTADFEMQKVALTALSGSMIDTEKIWSQIAAQSVKSPFALKDLVTYTKQLSAYRIENDKLFDTTKQLADISAGLGTDMNRLILAYGQVKAATVLRGTELRQFTEAGLDLLPALADKFTELNGTVTTTADVFDLISERAVPFEMVAEIFDDMTAAGGRFYNMQEIQSETIKGLLTNIQDQADLTKVALGDLNTGLIKLILSGTKGALEFAANNALLANSILSLVMAGTGYALSVGIQTEIQRRYNSEVLSGIKAKTIENLKFKESNIIRLKEAATTKGLTNIMKLYRVQLTGTTWQQRMYASGTILATNGTNMFARSLGKLKIAMATNPWTIAITALLTAASIIGSIVSEQTNATESIAKLREEYSALREERKKFAEENFNDNVNFETQKKSVVDYIKLLQKQNINIPINLDIINSPDDIAKIVAQSDAIAGTQEKLAAMKKDNEAAWDFDFSYKTQVTDLIQQYNELFSAITKEVNKLNNSIVTQLNEPNQHPEVIAYITELKKQLSQMPKESEYNYIFRMVDLLAEEVDYPTGRFSDYEQYSNAFAAVTADLKEQISNLSSDLDPEIKALQIKTIIDDTGFKAGYEELYNWAHFIYNIDIPVSLKPEDTNLLASWQTEFNKLNASLKEDLGELSKTFDISNTIDNVSLSQQSVAESISKSIATYKDILAQIQKGTPAFEDYSESKIESALSAQETLLNFVQRASNVTAPNDRTNEAVSLLKEELSLLADVNKAYADNLKVMSSDAAAKAVTDLYTDVFGDLKNFKGLKPTDVIDVAGLNSQYEKAKTIINKLLGEGTAKANKVILEFDKATTQNSAKEAMAIIKAEIDKLNKDIAKQQEASNFMDKILGLTSGNMELATSITMSVYGNTGEELEKAMVEQVRKAFSGGGVSSAVAKGVEDAIDGTDIDYVALQGLISQLPKDMQSSAEKIVKEGISANAKIVENLYKNLSKTKTYEDKRTDILRAGIKQRREIEESNLKDSEKEYLKGLSNDSESKQLQQLEFTDFKESDTYIQMFDRLETTSTATLDIMKRKLEDMREAWKDGLEPTQLKELQSRLNEISDELDTRGNPFTALKESITEYRAELAKANLAQREAALLKAQDIESEKKSTADIMGDSLASSELALIEARESGDQLRIAAAEALYRLNLANYNEANKEYIAAKEITETRQKDVKTLTTLDGKIIKLRKSTRALKQDLVTSMIDFASASNDALQAGVFGNLSDEVEGVVDSVVSAGMEIAQVTMSTIGAIQDTMEGAVWGMKAAAETGKEAISTVEKASVILAVISAALQIATKIADAISGAKDAQADADIEKAQMEVDRLNNSIDDLGDKADESFGKAKIGAMKMQDELREQQALAYDAMIMAEKSRKEPDQSQIAEWQRAGDLLRKEIADTGDYLEAYLGMDKMSAMTALKDAWMDIWSDMSSTPAERMDAIKGKWKEMLRDMMVNQMMMSVVSRQMDAFFDKIGDQIEAKGGELTEADYQAMLNEGLGLIEGLAPQMELLGQTMEKMGLRDIADAAEDTNGSLAQGVASATSEEVTTLSGYMSSVLQYQILSYAILDRWEKTGYGGVTIAGTDSKAQDGTFHLAAISTNTLNAANTLAEIREILDGVTTPIGSDKGISINVDVVG